MWSCNSKDIRIYKDKMAADTEQEKNCAVSAAFALLFADESPIIKIIDRQISNKEVRTWGAI